MNLSTQKVDEKLAKDIDLVKKYTKDAKHYEYEMRHKGLNLSEGFAVVSEFKREVEKLEGDEGLQEAVDEFNEVYNSIKQVYIIICSGPSTYREYTYFTRPRGWK